MTKLTQMVYSTTPDSDRGLRDILCEWLFNDATENKFELLDEMQTIMRNVPDLAIDFAEHLFQRDNERRELERHWELNYDSRKTVWTNLSDDDSEGSLSML